MNSIQQYQVALGVSLIIFSLNGCNPLPPQQRISLPPIPPTSAATKPTTPTSPIGPIAPIAATKPTTPATPTVTTVTKVATTPATPTVTTVTKVATKPTTPTVTTVTKVAAKPTTPATPTVTTVTKVAAKPTTPTVTTVTKVATKPTTPTVTTVTKVATKPTTPTVKSKSKSVDPQRKSVLKSAVIPDSVTVTIYQVDSQCQGLIPQKVPVNKEHPIESAVTKVLETQHNSDFDVNYRVILDRTAKLATIDLRIPANSKRQLVSLSSCEQLALFGSLRQTLTSNQGWEIQKVRFTKEGKEIWL